MQQLPNNYILQQTLPKKGGNGEIYICSKDDKMYAMKVFVKNVEQYLHEVNLCTTLKRHVNIVQLIDNFEWNGKKVIVLEYCHQDLKTYLQENLTLSEMERLQLFTQIVNAFKSIYEDLSVAGMYFEHRDIKPENLMLGEANQIKIIDFGESRLQDQDESFPTMKTQLCGTQGYMDPMMEFGNEGFQAKSDLWSMGATLYFILTNQRLPIEAREVNSKGLRIHQSKRKEFKLSFVQEMIDSALRKLQFSEECKELLNKLLRVDPKERFGWEELFDNQVIKSMSSFQTSESQPPRRKLIKLSEQLRKDFFSMTFKNQAGPILTETYYIMISKCQQCVLTAQKLFKYFNDLKQQNKSILDNWQAFEKCNYLLHLRSLIILNCYNQILTLRVNKYSREEIESKLLDDLTNNNEQNQLIFERIQLQIYYLFENVRKAMQGNGLEMRIQNLTRLSTKEGEENEYNELLQFNEKEKEYFQYKKNDVSNIKNRPETFDTEYFYELFADVTLRCIKILMGQYKQLDKEGIQILSDLVVSYQLDQFFTNSSTAKLLDYQYNKQTQNQEVWFTKLKVIIM